MKSQNEIEEGEDRHDEKPSPDEMMNLLMPFPPTPDSDGPKTRLMSLYGEIDEDRSSNVINGMYVLKELGKKEVPVDPEDPEGETTTEIEPIELLISSEGGVVSDMLSMIDVMRLVKQECDIHTLGVGKVMSAGVPLLAAGTKGQRSAGRYCRFMIHGVTGGNYGHMHDLRNEMSEVKWVQEQYINVLVENTIMTHRQIKNLFRKKIDIYFDAKQALAWGIIDTII